MKTTKDIKARKRDFTQCYYAVTKAELFQLAKAYFRTRGVAEDDLYDAIYRYHQNRKRSK